MKYILIFLLLFPSLSFATTATFQEGVSSYAGTKDASITSLSDNESITDPTITKIRAVSDGTVYILYFDISSIPTTATVSSATVQLYVDEQNCTAETIGVRSIQNPDNSGAFSSNSASGDTFNQYATWHYKNHGSTTKWSTGGGAVNFTDVYNNSDESTVSSGSCPGSVAKTLTVTNMVQTWVASPSSNGGMLFTLSNTGNVKVKSRFTGTAAERPLLTVTYTASAGTTNKFFQLF